MRYGVIGNIEGSRNIKSMNDVMKKLTNVLEEVSNQFSSDFIKPFELTIGDEFQGMLKSSESLIQMIYFIRYKMYPINIRFGIGVDSLAKDDKHGSSGKVWFRARDAVMFLKLDSKKKKLKTQAPIILNTSDDPVKDLVNETLNSLYFIETSWNGEDYLFFRRVVQQQGFTLKPNMDEMLTLFDLSPVELKTLLKNVGYFDFTSIIEKLDNVIDSHKWRV